MVRRLSPPPADAAACIPFAFSLILSSPSNHRSRWPSPAFFLSPLPPWRRRLSFPPLSCPYRSVRGSWTRTPLDSPLACTLPSTHGAMWSRGRPLAPTPTRVLCGCICRTHTVEGGGGHTFPSTEVWRSPPHLRYSAQVCHIGS